jgi:hypothetical protein
MTSSAPRGVGRKPAARFISYTHRELRRRQKNVEVP